MARGSRNIVAMLIILLISLGPVTEAQAFVDVRDHWAEATVEHLGTRDIIKGYPDGRFLPDQNITRAEMCRLLTGMLDGTEAAATLQGLSSVFPDVASYHWARGDIHFLYEQGVVIGDEEGLFNPDAFLRRDEAVVMLLRALKVMAAIGSDALEQYTDFVEVPDFAAGYFARGLRDGFLQGYPDNTLRPGGSITRAELAVLVERGLNYQGNEYQFWGQLLQFDRAKNQARIVLAGREARWIPAVVSPRIYNSEGQAVSLYDIGMPYNIYFNLDEDGRLVYARATGAESVGPLTVETRQPASPGSAVINPLAVSPPVELYESVEQQAIGYVLATPETSIEVNKQDMQITDLAAATQADGRDVLVAIIDTGIDPGHPDLQITVNGQRKIVDFIDFTSEGRVELSNTADIGTGWANLGVTTDLSRVRSISGKVKVGYWDEGRYAAPSVLADFNGNGRLGDKVLVVAADRERAGVYDTIYVDSNGNGDIRDEIPLRLYRDSKQYATFATPDGWGFNYVLSSLAADGSSVQFSFDSHGHGTRVAGVVAANGQMQGVAPDARLIVIKVAGSDGVAEPQALEQGMRRAAEMGAQIANVSMGAPGHPELAQAINEISRRYGTIFTVAVGNSGPGMGTVTDPASADEALRVGAYVSPAQWQGNYGWRTRQSTLWYFSSVGPRQDGALGPMLVAPGSVYSTTPLWQKVKYRLDEGTSVAAPHLAGGIAVLIDALMRQDQVVIPAKIKRSVLMSAVPLEGATLIEQGYGTVDINAAYNAYIGSGNVPQLAAAMTNGNNGVLSGLYAREYKPGAGTIEITNRDRDEYNLALSSNLAGIQANQERLLLPAQSGRSFSLWYNQPEQPGLYTGFIDGDDPDTTGIDLRIPQVMIIPYDLANRTSRLNLDGILAAGMVQRYFIQVPPDSGRLNVTLKVPRLNMNYMGRVRVHLFDPAGNEAARTGYAGYGTAGEPGISEVSADVDQPAAGVWEVVVYSTATLSLYHDDASEYSISMNIQDPGRQAYISTNKYLVSMVPGTIGDNKMITLQIRENDSLRPYDGPVMVDAQTYYVRDGVLRIPRPPKNTPHIYLTWQ